LCSVLALQAEIVLLTDQSARETATPRNIFHVSQQVRLIVGNHLPILVAVPVRKVANGQTLARRALYRHMVVTHKYIL
jgi:hypothetical protein